MANLSQMISGLFQSAGNAARKVYTADLSPAQGTQSIQDLTSRIVGGGWKQMTPFTATSFGGNELYKPLTDFSTNFFGAVPTVYSGGTINPYPEPTTTAGKWGKMAGTMVSAAPLYVGANAALEAIPAITKAPYLARVAADLGAGSLISSAITPGSLKTRASLLAEGFKDPINIGMSLAFPVASANARGGLKAIREAEALKTTKATRSIETRFLKLAQEAPDFKSFLLNLDPKEVKAVYGTKEVDQQILQDLFNRGRAMEIPVIRTDPSGFKYDLTHPSVKEAIQEEVKRLQDQVGGVTKKVVDGQTLRVSENPQWYRQFYQATGHAPTAKEWLDLAEQSLFHGGVDGYWQQAGANVVTDALKQVAKLDEVWPTALIEKAKAAPDYRSFLGSLTTEEWAKYIPEEDTPEVYRNFYKAREGMSGPNAPANAVGKTEVVAPKQNQVVTVATREDAVKALEMAKKSKKNIQIEVANPQGVGTVVREVTPDGKVINPTLELPPGEVKNPLYLPSGKKLVKNAEEARAAFRQGLPVEYQPKVVKPRENAKPLITMPPKDIAEATPGLRTIPSGEGVRKGWLRQTVERYMVDTRTQIQQMGPAGKYLADQMDNMTRRIMSLKGNWETRYTKAFKDISVDSAKKIFQFQEGKAVVLDTKEKKAWEVLRDILSEVAVGAKEKGLQIKRADGTLHDFAPLQNYFPHFADRELIKKNAQLVIDHLVSTGQMKPQDARDFVADVIHGLTVRDAYMARNFKNTIGRYGHLENSRLLDLPEEVLRFDKGVMGDYIEGAARRLAQAEAFGANNEDVENILTQIANAGGSKQIAQDFINYNTGVIAKTAEDVATQWIRRWQSAAKLPLFAVSNASQSVNTATVTGARRTLGTIFQYFTDAGFRQEVLDYALRTGEVSNSVLEDFARDINSSKKPFLVRITGIGGGSVESFNRVIAAYTGKKYAEDLVQQLIKNPNNQKVSDELVKLGLEPLEILKKGRLDDGDLIRAGQSIVERTQFRVNQADLPPGWSTTWGRVFTQYKSFAYKQSKFLLDEVIKEGIKGNVAPLARYLMLGAVAGEVGADLKSALYRRERPDNLGQRAVENIANVGGIGIVNDMFYAMKGGQSAINFVLGPTAGDFVKLAQAVDQAYKGNPVDLGRFAIGQIPLVGSISSRWVLPYPDQQFPVGPTMKVAANVGGRKVQREQITTKLEQSKQVSGPELDFYYLYKSDQLPSSTAYEGVLKRDAYLKDLATIYKDEKLTDDQKRYLIGRIAEKTKLSLNQLAYSFLADQSTEAKTAFVMQQLQQEPDRERQLQLLASGRVNLGGGEIVSSSVITTLEDIGFVSKTEAKMLRNIGSFRGQLYTKTGSTGGGKKITPIKFKSPAFTKAAPLKVSVSKAKIKAPVLTRPKFGKAATRSLRVKL